MGCDCNPSCLCIDNDIIDINGECDGSKIDLSKYPYWTEISVPGVVNIPEQKPNLEQINSVNVSIKTIRQKVIITPDSGTTENNEGKLVSGRKLIIEGLICLAVSYTACNPEQSVHTAHFEVPFSAYIVIPKTEQDKNFDIIPCIEGLYIEGFNERQIFINATVFLQAVPNKKTCLVDEGCNCDSEIIVKGLCSDTKISNLLSSTDKNWTEIFIPEIMNIPSCKPNIEEIMSVTSKIELISQRVIETPRVKDGATGKYDDNITNQEGTKLSGKKLVVEFILKQNVVYTACNPEQSVHSAHFDVPYSAFIVVPNATLLTTKFKVDLCIEDIFISKLNERQIFKNTSVFIKATELSCN